MKREASYASVSQYLTETIRYLHSHWQNLKNFFKTINLLLILWIW